MNSFVDTCVVGLIHLQFQSSEWSIRIIPGRFSTNYHVLFQMQTKNFEFLTKIMAGQIRKMVLNVSFWFAIAFRLRRFIDLTTSCIMLRRELKTRGFWKRRTLCLMSSEIWRFLQTSIESNGNRIGECKYQKSCNYLRCHNSRSASRVYISDCRQHIENLKLCKDFPGSGKSISKTFKIYSTLVD